MRPTTSRPTPKQLSYLKALAAQTATSFAYPRNRSEASREIARMRHLPVLASDRDSDDGRVLDSDRERRSYATAPAPGEIAGHGFCELAWTRGPAMSTPTAIRPRVSVGERVELGRYTVATGERVLYGQRVDGVVRVTDHPAAERGRCFLVERELEHEGPGAYAALQALIADYLVQARRLDAVPMSSSTVRHHLEQLGSS